MKKPRVIMHNTVSIDSSIKNFECDIGLHYQVAANYNADAHLIGSITAKTGLEMYSDNIPSEMESDIVKKKNLEHDKKPFWVIVDTRGKLKGLMHMYRRFEYCRDVIVLLSQNTPKDYVSYLKERDYEYIISGESQIDLPAALDTLYSKYKIKTILTDTGGILNSVLLENKLVEEISLIIAPNIVGENAQHLFKTLKNNSRFSLSLRKVEVLDKNYVFVRYNVSY
jgi:2,5-diamino-6-(ribosylamino)-4(3H)-pyrimidinone 5'-phosphate reductase